MSGYSFQSVFAEEKILPNWIKPLSEWWATGYISDNEFEHSIRFLVKNEILSEYMLENSDTVPRLYFITQPNESLNLAPYGRLDVVISGYFPPFCTKNYYDDDDLFGNCDYWRQNLKIPPGEIIVRVINPEGFEYAYDAEGGWNNTFKAKLVLKSNSPDGVYEIFAEKREGQIKLSPIVIYGENYKEKVFSYIKNESKLWYIDKISDSEFLAYMKFLINHNWLNYSQDEIKLIELKENILNNMHESCVEKLLHLSYSDFKKCDKDIVVSYDKLKVVSNSVDSNNDVSNPTDYDYNNDISETRKHDYSGEDPVQILLELSDYYAKIMLAKTDPYALQYINGQITYDEYESKAMDIFEYYTDQYVVEASRYLDDYLAQCSDC